MKRIVLILIGGALVFGACQSASEVLTEQILEQTEGVEDVKIDADTGEISIETDEGVISIGGGDLPDDFSVSLLDGYNVTAVFETEDGSSVSLTYAQGDYDELVSHFDAWTSGQPGEWNTSTATFEIGNDDLQRISSWMNETSSISVTDCFTSESDGTSFDGVCVAILDF